MVNNFIYVRGLRHVDTSVFCVSDGQKSYRDPIFSRDVPYSSGQQVKRSILELIGDVLQQERSPVTFVLKAPALEEGEVLSICDPEYYDQLLGGWMRTAQKDKSKEKKGKKTASEQKVSDDEGKTRTLRRRSPLSISAMRPIHPLLGGIESENMTFDRSDKPQIPNKVIVRDSEGNELSNAEISELLSGTDRSVLRKWLKPGRRATGLFVYDVVIDLRRLFAVSTNQLEPELSAEKIVELENKGWIKTQTAFGQCLVMPKEMRDKAIPAIAHALLNWRITSNQSRTFSLMETLAVAVSDNANTLAGAIRAKLVENGDRPKAKPILDETAGAELFVTLPCAGYIETEVESADALAKAEQYLIEQMQAFDYEHQI
jgi:hypothetical protein